MRDVKLTNKDCSINLNNSRLHRTKTEITIEGHSTHGQQDTHFSLWDRSITLLLSFDLLHYCCSVWTMMSLLLGELALLATRPTTGDMQTDAKSTLQVCEGGDVTGNDE